MAATAVGRPLEDGPVAVALGLVDGAAGQSPPRPHGCGLGQPGSQKVGTHSGYEPRSGCLESRIWQGRLVSQADLYPGVQRAGRSICPPTTRKGAGQKSKGVTRSYVSPRASGREQTRARRHRLRRLRTATGCTEPDSRTRTSTAEGLCPRHGQVRATPAQQRLRPRNQSASSFSVPLSSTDVTGSTPCPRPKGQPPRDPRQRVWKTPPADFGPTRLINAPTGPPVPKRQRRNPPTHLPV